MSRVSVSLLNLVCLTASSKGVEKRKLLDRLGLSEEIVNNKDNYVDGYLLGKAMKIATEMTDDPNFPLENGQNFEPGNLNVLGHLLANAPTMRRAYEMKIRYKTLVGEGVTFTPQENEEHLTIFIDHSPELAEYKRFCVESCSAMLVTFKRRFLGKRVDPITVYFEHERPENADKYESFFNCDVFFNQERTCVVYPVSVLDEKIVQSNPELFHIFTDYAEDLLGSITQENFLSRNVTKTLVDLVPQNKATIENVAERLAIGTRTLQRQLKNEGTNFNEILKNVRKELASRHLQNTRLSIAEISYMLGFSEPSIFHRFFKKWTGVTPKDYRLEVLGGVN